MSRFEDCAELPVQKKTSEVIKSYLLCMLFFCSVSLHANEKEEDVVYRLFEWYRFFGENLSSKPSLEELERFFTPDFNVISNGVEVCASCQEYLSHFSTLSKRCRSARTSSFLEEPILSGDKVVIRYNADVEELSGRRVPLQIIAILTIEQGKIAKWVEVLAETNPVYWE